MNWIVYIYKLLFKIDKKVKNILKCDQINKKNLVLDCKFHFLFYKMFKGIKRKNYSKIKFIPYLAFHPYNYASS